MVTRVRPQALLALCLLFGLLASGVLVWFSTRAVYSATTSNTSNTWAAGAVALTDDDGGSAQFAVTGMTPGQVKTHCITVTYGGTLSSAVTVYATASSGALRQYLNLTIEEGNGGSFGTCTGFTQTSVAYTGTVLAFAGAKTSWATGVGSFAPTAAGQKKSYRFTTTLDAAAPNSTMGNTATADLRWEAR